MNGLIRFVRVNYARADFMLGYLKSPLLLAIRLYWGMELSIDGWRKLHNLDKVTSYFTDLNLPAPHMTATFVSLVELVGGLLFALGIGTRLVALVLLINMTVAFLAAEKDAFLSVFSDPDKFQAATAYNDWFATLLIMVLGPGALSVDWFFRRKTQTNR